MSSTDRQKYFEYEPDQGGKWWLKEPPSREKWFEDALIDLAGLHDGRKPRLRVVWGGTEKSDISKRPQLKYKAVREICTGFYYITKKGETKVTLSMNLPRDARVPWEFHPRKERIELGRLRWAIEKYVPPEELATQGWPEKLRSPEGKKILREELLHEGIYEHYWWIQTARHRYRDLDSEVLTAVQAMYLYNINTSEAQKALDAIERRKNQTLIGASEANAIWQSVPH